MSEIAEASSGQGPRVVDTEEFSKRLEAALRQDMAGVIAIADLCRLSGGASQETWALDALSESGSIPLILRRNPSGADEQRKSALNAEAEAHVLEKVRAHEVPVPKVRLVLNSQHGLGHGFLMDRVEGETLPRNILRDASFAKMRSRLAGDLGKTLAKIHRLTQTDLPFLRSATAKEEVLYHREMFASCGASRPVFELAFRWLLDHLPDPQPLALVHGDFRNGNFVVGPEGLRSILDWELAHIGDPIEDLGWLCVNSWRFGNIDLPVGGFGLREDLIESYGMASGSEVSWERVKFWEVFGTLKWGIFCLLMVDTFRRGQDKSVEKAVIGRRASETEIDLLRLLSPRK